MLSPSYGLFKKIQIIKKSPDRYQQPREREYAMIAYSIHNWYYIIALLKNARKEVLLT